MRKIIFIIFFCFSFLTNGQTPQAISYQGVARDSVGHALINQNIGIRLSILDSSNTGQAVYIETHSVNTNSTGLFNLSIGLGTTVSGNFSTIPWGQGDKWLKVEIIVGGGNNYQLIGVTQFLSVPYALYSNSSGPKGTNIGDMQYWNGIAWTSLPVGSYGQTLALCNGVPTWGGCLPLLTTTIGNVYYFKAISGGNITNDGGSFIIAKGVCWSTSSNPTIANYKTIDGTGSGAFTSNITGLVPNTTYNVRAYAINSVGTTYGNEISFTTLAAANLPSITICSQIWSSQNLSVSTYRNGDPIPRVNDPNLWANLTTGAYCYYNSDSATYAAIYGKLYNWYAVNDPRGLAPAGWHIPSDAEWAVLEICLGGSSVSGGKMKTTGTIEAGTGLWQDPNSDASNLSGFAGLPGGYLNYQNGAFYNIGIYGEWWSSTENENSTTLARLLALIFSQGSSSREYGDKLDGFSVRCVRD